MNEEKLVSIIIPVYNVVLYLEKCIESVLTQTYPNIEIILIDDGSSDGSENICNQYKKNNKIKVIHQKNRGVGAARNKGIQEAKGKYIVFVDSDDYVESTLVEELIKKQSKEYELVVCGIFNENEYRLKKSNIVQKELIFQKEVPSIKETESYLNALGEYIPDPYFGAPYAKLYIKEILEKNNIKFEENEVFAEDLIFNLKYYQNISKIGIIPQALYHYRAFVATSLSQKKHSYVYMKKRWKIISQEYEKVYSRRNIDVPKKRIEQVIYNYLSSSIINDGTILQKTKKIYFYQDTKKFLSGDLTYKKCLTLWYKKVLKYKLKGILRKGYRVLQQIVHYIRFS